MILENYENIDKLYSVIKLLSDCNQINNKLNSDNHIKYEINVIDDKYWNIKFSFPKINILQNKTLICSRGYYSSIMLDSKFFYFNIIKKHIKDYLTLISDIKN